MAQLRKLAFVVILGAAVTACETGPDPADQVREALEAANIEDVRVNYDEDSRAIHLTGSVDSAADRQRAEQVAATAVGTTGNVLNELTVDGPAESQADNLDGTIRDRLNEMVDKDPALTDRDVNFDVNNGAVEIKGSVASAAEKTRIGEMARAVPGVKDMVNGLEVRPDEYADQKRPAGTTER